MAWEVRTPKRYTVTTVYPSGHVVIRRREGENARDVARAELSSSWPAATSTATDDLNVDVYIAQFNRAEGKVI